MGALANQLSQFVQVSGAMFALAGERIMQALQIAHLPIVRNALENKIQVLGTTFLFSTVAQSMSKTDAFEIYVNGELMFSKLETKRLPTWEEIAQALAKHGLVLDDAELKAHLQQKQRRA